MPVSFSVRGIEEVKAMLEEVKHGAKRIAIQAFTDYLIGDDNHGLKHYPPYTTQKVRARTFQLKEGWTRSGDEYKPVIRNYVPYAPYVPVRWKKYGWRQWGDVIMSNVEGATRHAQSLVNKFLEKWR